jgi:hypothetical protein
MVPAAQQEVAGRELRVPSTSETAAEVEGKGSTMHVEPRISPIHARVLGLAAMIALAPGTLDAATIRIGPSRAFTTLESAINGRTYGPGDTLQLDAGRFAVGSMLKPLGSGASGRPIVVRGAGMGRTIVSGEALDNTKALWDVEQGNAWWVFEDLTVSGMRGAQTNARGFFLVGCQDVVVQRCEVTDCWNGFMSAGDARRVTVQHCDVHHNGGVVGPAHNFYMNSGTDFVIQYNWIHDSEHGICYKDRTHNLQLLYNRIERGTIQGYEISLAGDGSGDQGQALLLGNLLVKDAGSAQQTHFVRFEDGRTGTLVMVHNTLVGQPRNVLVSSIASRNILHNNVFDGGATTFSGGAVEGTNNWMSSGRSVAGLSGTVSGATPRYTNSGAGDFRLGAGSPCIDAANAAVSPRPIAQWNVLLDPEERVVRGRGPDIGAFESPGSGTPVEPATWSTMKARFR